MSLHWLDGKIHRTMTVPKGRKVCPDCTGGVLFDEEQYTECITCEGSGTVEEEYVKK